MACVCLTYVCDGPLVVFINFFCFAARWCPLGSLFFVIVPISINVLPLADFIIYFLFHRPVVPTGAPTGRPGRPAGAPVGVPIANAMIFHRPLVPLWAFQLQMQ